jgi:hypothetical protein
MGLFLGASADLQGGAGTGRLLSPNPRGALPPLFGFFGIRCALLDAISHALIRLCNPKQNLPDHIV